MVTELASGIDAFYLSGKGVAADGLLDQPAAYDAAGAAASNSVLEMSSRLQTSPWKSSTFRSVAS